MTIVVFRRRDYIRRYFGVYLIFRIRSYHYQAFTIYIIGLEKKIYL